LVSMHLFVSPRYGQKVRQAPGPVPVRRDTTLSAVWLFFKYTGCVKESRWKRGWKCCAHGAMVRPDLQSILAATHPHLRSEMWGTRLIQRLACV
jgi:hypothetical protein